MSRRLDGRPEVRSAGLSALALTTASSGAAMARVGAEHMASAIRDSAPAAAAVSLTTGALALAGAAILAWYTLSAAVALVASLARSLGGVWWAGETLLRRAGAPLLRGVLGAGAALSVGLGSACSPAPASAHSPSDEAMPVGVVAADAALPLDLGYHADEDHPGAESGLHTVASGPVPASEDAADRPTARDHTVHPGDTLWSIAQAHLPPGAATAEIASAWPVWHELNRDVIGPDPDLILPGQVLANPDEESA